MYNHNDSETVISAEQLGRSVPRPDAMLLNPPARTRVSDEYAQPQGCMWRVWVQVYFTGGCPGGERADRLRASRIGYQSAPARSTRTAESDRRPPTVITGRDVSCAGSVAECC